VYAAPGSPAADGAPFGDTMGLKRVGRLPASGVVLLLEISAPWLPRRAVLWGEGSEGDKPASFKRQAVQTKEDRRIMNSPTQKSTA
jgi:hypothetical protein